MNGFRYANILSRVLNTPLFAHPTKALIFYNAFAGRFGTAPVAESMIAGMPDLEVVNSLRARDPVVAAAREGRLSEKGDKPAPEASRFMGAWPVAEDGKSIEPFRLTREGVGIITVTGSLINRGAWVGSYSGETSYEGIGHQLRRAGADSRVKSVILDMETPGGEAVGTAEVAGAVRALAAIKPVFAVANGMAASAGYAIASGATKIINTPTGLLGSIGVVMLHLDYSEALKQEGISPTLIFAGSHKTTGNSLEPLSDSAREELQGEVNQFYDLFLSTVAEGRGRRMSAKAARDTQARTFIGKAAIDAKLADDIGTFEEVLAELSKKPTRSGGNSSARSSSMSNQVEGDDARNEGRTEGLRDGAAAERERIATVLAHADVRGREAFAMQLISKSPGMTAQDVIALCQQIPAPAPAAAAPQPPAPAPAPAPAQTQQIPSVAQREAGTGVDQITSHPIPGAHGGPAPGGGAPIAGASWDKHVEAVNTSIKQRNPRALLRV